MGRHFAISDTRLHVVERGADGLPLFVFHGGPSLDHHMFGDSVEQNLAAFEPVELREQVTQSWAREQHARTTEECDALLHDQLPFHFADPRDPRIAEYEGRTAGVVHTPDVLRHFAAADYGGIEVEDRLGEITQPVLVLAGRHDRTCMPAAGEAIAAGVPDARLTVFEQSGHMTFVEENDAYLAAVRRFLQSVP